MVIFINSCADIHIASNDNHVLLTDQTTVASNSILLFPFINPGVGSQAITPPTILYPKAIEPITTTTTIATTAAAAPMNFIFPFEPLKELLEQLDRNNKTLRCYPTNEALKPLIGIENWCLQLCAINCPPSLCICVRL